MSDFLHLLVQLPNTVDRMFLSIIVSEDSGNADTITLSITDAASSPATFSLFKTKAISANATTELLSQDCLVLKASEILKAQAATANRLHVIVSIQEYYTGIG